MSLRFIARIVFVLAMAISLGAPLAGSAAACPPETNPGLC
jgi:hypothetical protein